MKHNRGFTILELLVVIALIAILACLVFPRFLRAKELVHEKIVVGTLRAVASANEQFHLRFGRYAAELPLLHKYGYLDESYSLDETTMSYGYMLKYEAAANTWELVAAPVEVDGMAIDDTLRRRITIDETGWLRFGNNTSSAGEPDAPSATPSGPGKSGQKGGPGNGKGNGPGNGKGNGPGNGPGNGKGEGPGESGKGVGRDGAGDGSPASTAGPSNGRRPGQAGFRGRS